MPVQRTLAIIKPDATARPVAGAILAMAEQAGLRVVGIRMMRPMRSLFEELYAEHADQPWFGDQIAYMASGPVIVAVLEGEDAVATWRRVMGPTDCTKAPEGTVRRRYALSYRENSVHGSDSPESAAREIDLFFLPGEILG